MKRASLSLAGGLAAALLVVSAPAAQAAVSAKDVPNQGDLVKAFPELAGGQFSTDKTKEIGAPGKTCGVTVTQKARSAVAITGASPAGQPVVVAGVAELKSITASKAYLAKYKKYVKACPSYTEPTTGATVTLKLASAPKVGQAALGVAQETTVMGITSYASTVLIRDGKRIASVVAIDDAPVPATAMTSLAKVTAKKMK